MSKTIPTSYSSRNLVDYRARSPIRAQQWGALAEQLHHIWAHTGARFGGHTWSPPWQAQASTATTANANAGLDLDSVEMVGVLDRRLANDQVKFEIELFGSDVTLDWQLIRVADGTVLADQTASIAASTAEWEIDTATVGFSDVHDANQEPQLLRVEMQAVEESDGDTSKIYHVSAQEAVIGDPNLFPGAPETFTVSPTFTSTSTTTSSPGAIRTQSPTVTSDATVTSVPAAIRTQSPTVTSDATVTSSPGAIRTQSPTVTSDATVTSTAEKISGAFLLGLGQAEYNSNGTYSEGLADINTSAYGERALVEYLTGQDVYNEPNINPYIALGNGGFEDGLVNELDASKYSRGSVSWYNPAEISVNSETVYGRPNDGQVIAGVEDGATVSYDSFAVVDGASVGSGLVAGWGWLPETTTDSDVTFADQELLMFSGLADLGLAASEFVVYTLTGQADWPGAPTSTITPHVTLFDADPGQSGSTNEIAGSRVTVTSWSNLGQKNDRFAAENDNSFTISVPDGVDATHIGIYDGDQGSGANQLIAGSLGEPLTPDANNNITFDATSVRVAAG